MNNRLLLSEVLRHDGTILSLATNVREMPKGGLPRIQQAEQAQSKVQVYRDAADLHEGWLEQLSTAVAADQQDSVVMLTWTNRERRRANKAARVRLFGPDVPDFKASDKLVMLKALELDGQIVLSNNADI